MIYWNDDFEKQMNLAGASHGITYLLNHFIGNPRISPELILMNHAAGLVFVIRLLFDWSSVDLNSKDLFKMITI